MRLHHREVGRIGEAVGVEPCATVGEWPLYRGFRGIALATGNASRTGNAKPLQWKREMW